MKKIYQLNTCKYIHALKTWTSKYIIWTTAKKDLKREIENIRIITGDFSIPLSNG